jgi:hypothetical protein
MKSSRGSRGGGQAEKMRIVDLAPTFVPAVRHPARGEPEVSCECLGGKFDGASAGGSTICGDGKSPKDLHCASLRA